MIYSPSVLCSLGIRFDIDLIIVIKSRSRTGSSENSDQERRWIFQERQEFGGKKVGCEKVYGCVVG
jgi:hypothetical protein